MELATTAKFAMIRSDNAILAALSQEEWQIFIATAMMKHFQHEYGVRATDAKSGHIYWVIGELDEIERAVPYYEDGNPRYVIEELD